MIPESGYNLIKFLTFSKSWLITEISELSYGKSLTDDYNRSLNYIYYKSA